MNPEVEGVHAFYGWRLSDLRPWKEPHPANPWPDLSPEGLLWLKGWKDAADIECARLETLINRGKISIKEEDRLFTIQEKLYR